MEVATLEERISNGNRSTYDNRRTVQRMMGLKMFCVFPHQEKERPFVNAMRNHGWAEVDKYHCTILLVDVDSPDRMKQFEDRGRRKKLTTFTYPHAARPNLFWDGLLPPWEHTSGTFVFAKGHKEVMELYGYPHDIHVCGWAYSKLHSFRRKSEPKKILFAPIHPNQSTFLSAEDKKINHDTFEKLVKFTKTHGYHLTVRYIEKLEQNGIYEVEGVEYTHGDKRIGTQEKQMIEHDLVVAHQTFAWISIALGVPTVLMGEDTCPKIGKNEEVIQRVSTWNTYKHLIKFPLDILDGDAQTIIKKAITSELPEVIEWKANMIGNPFDEHVIVSAINEAME